MYIKSRYYIWEKTWSLNMASLLSYYDCVQLCPFSLKQHNFLFLYKHSAGPICHILFPFLCCWTPRLAMSYPPAMCFYKTDYLTFSSLYIQGCKLNWRPEAAPYLESLTSALSPPPHFSRRLQLETFLTQPCGARIRSRHHPTNLTSVFCL